MPILKKYIPVTVKHICPHCQGTIIGMADNQTEAQARANFNYSQHVTACSKNPVNS